MQYRTLRPCDYPDFWYRAATPKLMWTVCVLFIFSAESVQEKVKDEHLKRRFHAFHLDKKKKKMF